jgi:hypothetical protein
MFYWKNVLVDFFLKIYKFTIQILRIDEFFLSLRELNISVTNKE